MVENLAVRTVDGPSIFIYYILAGSRKYQSFEKSVRVGIQVIVIQKIRG